MNCSCARLSRSREHCAYISGEAVAAVVTSAEAGASPARTSERATAPLRKRSLMLVLLVPARKKLFSSDRIYIHRQGPSTGSAGTGMVRYRTEDGEVAGNASG